MTELRPQSTASAPSLDEFRPLSPDSPIPWFKQQVHVFDLAYLANRSPSPVSDTSDWEDTNIRLESLFEGARPDSPESIRPQSTASTPSLDEYRPLSPDSPLPWFKRQVYVFDFGYLANRSPSPVSEKSDWEDDSIYVESLFEVAIPDSPESADFEPKSFERPKPSENDVFEIDTALLKQALEEDCSLTYHTEKESASSSPSSGPMGSRDTHISQGSSEWEIIQLSSLPQHRPLSPDSLGSEDENLSFLEQVFADTRSTSESFASFDENRQLSPDSPIPQFSYQYCDHLDFSENRSLSPESIISDWEGSDSGLDHLFDGNRPASPASFLFDSDLDEYRPLSPESISSLDDFLFTDVFNSESRPSSPESVAFLNKYRPLSPDSPICQHFQGICDYYLQFSEARSFSLASEGSELEYTTYCLEELFSENRPESPESFSSEYAHEIDTKRERPICILLPSDAMLQSDADVVKSISDSSESVSRATSSPTEIEFSENEYTQSFLDYWLSELKPPEHVTSLGESEKELVQPMTPESMQSSISLIGESTFSSGDPLVYKAYSETGSSECTVENQAEVLCDTPVQQHPDEFSYFESRSDDKTDYSLPCPTLTEYTVQECHSSTHTSPSEIIETGLIVPTLYSTEWELIEGISSPQHRPLSPESLTGSDDRNLLSIHHMIADMRPPSPESVASYRPLSPDSPILKFNSQYCRLEFSEDRAISPESIISDWECSDPGLYSLFEDNRPQSPDSIVIDSEFHKSFKGLLLKNRPLSPESVSSVDDFLFPEVLFSESRPSSPESVALLNEYRRLSPDSPIPQYGNPIYNDYLEFYGTSPFSSASENSELEYTTYNIEELFAENRPDSPGSFSSENDHHIYSKGQTHMVQSTSALKKSESSGEGDIEICQVSPPTELWSSETEYTQTFLDYWLSALPAPEHIASLGESEKEPLTQSDESESSLVDEITFSTEDPLVYKPGSSMLTSHMYDPLYKGPFFYSGAQSSECTEEDQTGLLRDTHQSVGTEEQQSPEMLSHIQSISDDKMAGESSLTHAKVTDYTVPECPTDTPMSQPETPATGPIVCTPDSSEWEMVEIASFPDEGDI
jgi:hypothetical protein